MGIEYCVRLTCDAEGCKTENVFAGSTEALEYDWSMLPHGWLCPWHSQLWREAQNSEPTDEDLLK